VLTFGLVTVPVQMFTATQDHSVRFHQFQRGTGDRVRNRRVNERTGKDVEYGDIVKGYDLGGGDYVLVEPDELEEIAPGRSQVIEVSGFVDLDRVEPVYFDRAYYLAPQKDEFTRVYELLRAAMERSRKIGVATFVMRAKQYLVALRAQEDVLVLHTLHWADEVRDPERELPRLPDHTETRDRELQTAEQLIDALSIPWKPEEYHDTYDERVRELIDAKRKGEEIVTEEGPPQATNVVDLMDALRRSVDQASGEKPSGERPSAQRPSGEKAPAGKTAGKTAAKKRGAKKAAAGGKRAEQPRGGRTAARTEAPKRTGGARARTGGRAQRPESRAELAELSKHELYQRATDRGVPGRSKMSRDELIDALTAGPAKAAS